MADAPHNDVARPERITVGMLLTTKDPCVPLVDHRLDNGQGPGRSGEEWQLRGLEVVVQEPSSRLRRQCEFASREAPALTHCCGAGSSALNCPDGEDESQATPTVGGTRVHPATARPSRNGAMTMGAGLSSARSTADQDVSAASDVTTCGRPPPACPEKSKATIPSAEATLSGAPPYVSALGS